MRLFTYEVLSMCVCVYSKIPNNVCSRIKAFPLYLGINFHLYLELYIIVKI